MPLHFLELFTTRLRRIFTWDLLQVIDAFQPTVMDQPR